jgi:hypothetical protein
MQPGGDKGIDDSTAVQALEARTASALGSASPSRSQGGQLGPKPNGAAFSTAS